MSALTILSAALWLTGLWFLVDAGLAILKGHSQRVRFWRGMALSGLFCDVARWLAGRLP